MLINVLIILGNIKTNRNYLDSPSLFITASCLLSILILCKRLEVHFHLVLV